MIQGAFFFAFANNSLILFAPIPENNSINSDPDVSKNGTLASPAIAFDINVFPVPGSPISKQPRGIFAPIFLYFNGFFRKSTISCISIFASSTPCTSVNLVFGFFAAALSSVKNIPPAPPLLDEKYTKNAINSNVGKIENININILENGLISFFISILISLFKDNVLFIISFCNSGVPHISIYTDDL